MASFIKRHKYMFAVERHILPWWCCSKCLLYIIFSACGYNCIYSPRVCKSDGKKTRNREKLAVCLDEGWLFLYIVMVIRKTLSKRLRDKEEKNWFHLQNHYKKSLIKSNVFTCFWYNLKMFIKNRSTVYCDL